MLEHVDPTQIPKYFGGTMTDEDGDPKCTHKVCGNNFVCGFFNQNDFYFQLNWGGKVPKEMYTVRDANDNNNDDFIDTVIKKGSKLKLDFLCNDPSCVLKYKQITI